MPDGNFRELQERELRLIGVLGSPYARSWIRSRNTSSRWPWVGPIHGRGGRYYLRLDAYALLWILPPGPLPSLVRPHPAPSLYERRLSSRVRVLQPVPEGGVLGAGQPVVGIPVQCRQLLDHAGEVADGVPGYVLRVLWSHLWGAEHAPPPGPRLGGFPGTFLAG
jgi:hypothetical protein